MDRFVNRGRVRGVRSRGRARGSSVRAILSEKVNVSDEFLSLAEESNFIENGEDSITEESTNSSDVNEVSGIPDSAFLGGKAVDRPKLPPWFLKFYGSLLAPPPELKLSPNCLAASCKVCVHKKQDRTYNCATIRSLSNLRRHVKRHHSTDWEEWEK